MLQSTTLQSYETNIRPKLHALHAEIRQALREHPEGLTNQELGARLGKYPSTVSGIVRPLVKDGKLYEAGERKCRITGNKAKVWKLAGQQSIQQILA